MSKHNEEVVREQSCLKQQCTEAIRQWDIALREKNKLQDEVSKVTSITLIYPNNTRDVYLYIYWVSAYMG